MRGVAIVPQTKYKNMTVEKMHLEDKDSAVACMMNLRLSTSTTMTHIPKIVITPASMPSSSQNKPLHQATKSNSKLSLPEECYKIKARRVSWAFELWPWSTVLHSMTAVAWNSTWSTPHPDRCIFPLKLDVTKCTGYPFQCITSLSINYSCKLHIL